MKINKDIIYVVVIVLLAGLCAQFYYDYQYKPVKEREINVYYNQDRQLNKELAGLIQDADKFVYFAVYTFTRADLKDALLSARHRGLKVIGLTDRKQAESLEAQTKLIKELREAGIPVYEQDHYAIMHLKVLVTDKAYASGSYNWTQAATNLNDEVLEIGRDEALRAQYQKILEKLFKLYGETKK
jgi:phosphatidylserine/phosphatidylglycerophosphate/cardiolipin synthase-like enzyme